MPIRIATDRPGVIWHGPLFVHTSLALVNRELALALLDAGHAEIGFDDPAEAAFGAEADSRFGALAGRLRVWPADPAVTVRHFWPPDFRRPDTPALVLMQPWEFGSLPAAWVPGVLDNVDEVWAYSRYVRDIYVAAGIPTEMVHVVPAGVNTRRFHPGVAPIPLPTERAFRFLFVGGTIARKGIDVLLDAYTSAFTDRDDVTLIVKDFGVGSFYQGQDAGALIAALRARPGAPEIVHLTRDMSEDEIAGLYAACDCLVHPYRGEGFALTIAEAMACGKPVVCTGHGAALDYANEENAFLIPATVSRFAERRVGAIETVDFPSWAEPDREALTAMLREIAADPEAARARGVRAAQDVVDHLTWAHAATAAAGRIAALVRGVPHALARRREETAEAADAPKQRALAAARAGDWATARALAQAWWATHREDADIANCLAVARYRTGDADGAMTLLCECLERHPEHRDFHHNLAFVLLESGRAHEAIEHALAAARASPDSVEIRRTLERCRAAVARDVRRLRKAGRAGKADAAYEVGREAVRRADQALVGLGRPAPSAPGRPRVSLVMIARDEERFLPDCLESAREVVDEMVLVDTGSTDATVRIAEGFGARIARHVWSDDFSEARNVSLQAATGDWALWLDADERLAAGQAAAVRALVASAPAEVGGYLVSIRSFMQTRDNAEVCWHRALRLFRLTPHTRFTGRVHEQNARSLQEAGYRIEACELVVDHLGYAPEVMDARNKHERFIRMLHREVEEGEGSVFHSFHLFNLGNAYFTAGDIPAAVPWLERAAEHPNTAEEYSAVLFVELATGLYMTGRTRDALAACDRAESLGVRHPGIDFARGHALLRARDYSGAEQSFRHALEQGAGSTLPIAGDAGAYSYKARYGLGLALVGQERLEEAMEACRQVLAEQEAFVDARYLLADTQRRLRRLPQAVEEYERVLAQRPEMGPALDDLGLLLVGQGDPGRALPILRRATAARDAGPNVWAGRASAAEQLGHLVEARDAYACARRQAPGSVELMVNHGRVLAALGEDAAAIDAFADAIEVAPTCANAYFNAADVLYRLGVYDRAAGVLERGTDIDPANAAGWFVLGNSRFQLGAVPEAIAAYDRALALRPDYPEAIHNRALAAESRAA